MTTSLMPQASSPAPALPIIRPLREAATFVGLVTLIILGVAFALPHANVVQLLTMVSPLVVVGLITAFGTPRGQRRKLWGTLGVKRAGLRSWPAALVLSAVIVFVVPYGVADLLGSIAFKPLSTSPAVWFNGVTNLAIAIVIVTLLAFSAYAVILAPVAFAHTATESGFVTMAATVVLAGLLLTRGRTWGR